MKARRIPIQQGRGGWHRTDDPVDQDDKDVGPKSEPEDKDAEAEDDEPAMVRRRSMRGYRRAAGLWMDKLREMLDAGRRSPGTVETSSVSSTTMCSRRWGCD